MAIINIDEYVTNAKKGVDDAIESLSELVMGRAFPDCAPQEHCDRLQSVLNDLLNARTKLHQWLTRKGE